MLKNNLCFVILLSVLFGSNSFSTTPETIEPSKNFRQKKTYVLAANDFATEGYYLFFEAQFAPWEEEKTRSSSLRIRHSDQKIYAPLLKLSCSNEFKLTLENDLDANLVLFIKIEKNTSPTFSFITLHKDLAILRANPAHTLEDIILTKEMIKTVTLNNEKAKVIDNDFALTLYEKCIFSSFEVKLYNRRIR